ncbi:MAG TPA: co-chaperone GroES [Actinocrinis sp.]|nr:co-chaperone GroES [Actinocrinis sp.]HXR71856.1 co-chaperone GroES [Actinocrinis sp.]
MSPRSKSDDEKSAVPAEGAPSLKNTASLNNAASLDKLPIKMLHDRVLVRSDGAEGERRSSGGILIPATAQMSHRLAWAQVVAIGQNVRTVEIGDRVLYDPDDRAEVEVRGVEYVLLRERDIHAVAAERLGDSSGATGLYL